MRWKEFSICLALAAASGSLVAQLEEDGRQNFHQGSPVPGQFLTVDPNARYGSTLAVGDYNCDGLDDVAIGLPNYDVSGNDDAGGVIVLYARNTSQGLSTTDRQFFTQVNLADGQDPDPGEHFGRELASGNFNGGTCDDLVIGVPEDVVEFFPRAGSVHVLYGSANGLVESQFRTTFWSRADDDINPAPASIQSAEFGSALAVGDFNDDGFDDLAIGAPDLQSVTSTGGVRENSGAVHILFGSSGPGLGEAGNLLLRRGLNLEGEPDEGERLGAVLAAGDTLGGTVIPGDQLFIGLPNFDLGLEEDVGALMLVRDIGQVQGAPFSATFHQDSSGIPGGAEPGDDLGAALATGDFDGDGFIEIAAWVRGEDLGIPVVNNVGAVNLFDFTGGGGHQFWDQNDIGFEQGYEENDRFGAAMVGADFNGDGIDDLAIGVPREDITFGPINTTNVGVVHVLNGRVDEGLSVIGVETWFNEESGLLEGDRFGAALAAGSIRGNPSADLVVGVPFDDPEEENAGSIAVIYSARSDGLFSDRFED